MRKSRRIITVIIFSLFIMGVNGKGQERIENKAKANELLSHESIEIPVNKEMRSSGINNLEVKSFVAHAGGRLKGITLTNALEALNKSYQNGYRYIEVDFEWTSDGFPVLLHSWDGVMSKLLGAPPGRYTLKNFKELKMINHWHQMDLDDLANWMKAHHDVFIITDTKGDNIKLLSYIKEHHSDIQNQFIPQIYTFEEYKKATELGYTKIILTLYKTYYSKTEIVNFVKKNKLFAITMAVERANTELLSALDKLRVFTYCHTVNDLDLGKRLLKMGVDGFYTDDLKLNGWSR